MPKLPRIGTRKIEQALRRAGFEEDRQKGGHLVLRHPESGRRAIVPQHAGTLPVGTVREIIRQAGLTVEQFRDLLE